MWWCLPCLSSSRPSISICRNLSLLARKSSSPLMIMSGARRTYLNQVLANSLQARHRKRDAIWSTWSHKLRNAYTLMMIWIIAPSSWTQIWLFKIKISPPLSKMKDPCKGYKRCPLRCSHENITNLCQIKFKEAVVPIYQMSIVRNVIYLSRSFKV